MSTAPASANCPLSTHAGARIAIRDGATFFAVTPLPGTDLGGGNAVVLREGTPQVWNKITFKPALVIDSYNLKSESVVADPDWDRIRTAFGGFALELADRSDYPSFEAFERHLAASAVQTHFTDLANASVSYQSGDDLLETKLAAVNGELALIEPKVNGRAAFLPPGILRDTTTSVQGTAAAIEKSGAVLRGEVGSMKFLQVEPETKTFVAWHPLPDLDKFSFSVPGGFKIQADGRVGLVRVQVNPLTTRVTIEQAWREGQQREPDAATAFVLTGFDKPPTVEFNGAVRKHLATRMIHGERAYLVPLRAAMKSARKMAKALAE